MKKFAIFLGTLFLFLSLSLGVNAADSVVIDDADLLSASEMSELTNQMNALAEKTKAPMMIITSYDLDQDDPRFGVDRRLGDYVGDNQNGILFYLDMTGRTVYLSTSGNMIHYLTDSRIDQALDAIYEGGLTDGNYFSAAQIFIQETEKYFDAGVPGGHYTVDEATGKVTKYKTITLLEGIIAFVLAAGLALAFYFITRNRYRLTKVDYAYSFSEHGTLDLTEKEDPLVNSFITTRRIPKVQNNNKGGGGGGGGSTTHSSGGGSFGGGSRGF
ncbi:TPM domain-containing protein [Enterococcus timonensis]|uniref:TPM domain-containing protein n=1 Tax=Enterococcus timonensis TaxID=1852364 RepID=UPI0008DA0851|nr:TPM domain-containing protein [Enterococcus timonensis]